MKNSTVILMIIFVFLAVFLLMSALESSADHLYPKSRPASLFDKDKPTGERYYSPLKKDGE